VLLDDKHLINRLQYHVVYINVKTENESYLTTGQIAYHIRLIKWTLFRLVRIPKPPLNTILRTYKSSTPAIIVLILSLQLSHICFLQFYLLLRYITCLECLKQNRPSFQHQKVTSLQHAVPHRRPGEFSVTSSTLGSYVCWTLITEECCSTKLCARYLFLRTNAKSKHKRTN
jgi:hypothetical protein